MTMVNSYPDKMNLSFSGCGFLCIYHAGVAAAIKEYAPHLTENKISGASAGAIVAAGLVCGVCISQATSTILKVVTQARSRALGPLHPAFNLLGIVREEIHKTLPPDAYLRCTGRLQISLTRWSDSKNVIVTEYDSNEELIDAIICSCFIPVYCGMIPPKYRGVPYIDGGFTDNQPEYDDHTVTVSPFSGESDICPPDWDSASFFGISFSKTSIRFTTRNLFRLTACLMPPSTEDCSKMCLQGFEDALRFLTKNAMAPCIRCLTVQTNSSQTPGQVAIPIDDRRGMSPMSIRTRKRTSSAIANSKRRGRFDSECDTCCDSDHKYTSSADTAFGPSLPTLVQRTFDEAFSAEDSIFKYLLAFRMFRYSRVVLGVGKLPFDMFLVFSKKIIVKLHSTSAPAWIIERFTSIIDFIKTEIDTQKLRYSVFSCQLALTELDKKKRHQVSVEHKETQLEMSEQAKVELEMLNKRDCMKKKSPAKPEEVVNWAGNDDVDNYEHVVEYTRNHDAMYAFHYLDENNKVRSYELFNMAEPQRRHMCHTQQSPGKLPQRPVSMVLEEEECAPGGSHEDGDSGLSGIEQASTSGKRDACCSPVHYFPNAPSHHTRTSLGARRPSVRRHPQPVTLPSVSRRSVTRDAISSDSEVDGGERLFIPDRRLRRPSSDYDGEPEPSDTDVGC